MAREINLVPDIKNDMIKALKLRNLIFFLAIVVASASVGITLITGLIVAGQQLAVDSKQATIDSLSNKLNSYSDLKDFLTIKDQVGAVSELTSNKKVLSRTFNILTALIPTGADTIKISELNVDLSDENPVFNFDAQANAGQEPFIDYNVLDAFKKSMKYMRYDYGKYVDKYGDDIPAYCMIESAADGSIFNDSSRGLYAFWTITADGCAPASAQSDDDSTNESSSSISNPAAGYSTEEYEGQTVVRVWRTPQFNDWYKESEVQGQPYMDTNGNISNVAHFVSSCYTYTGDTTSGTANPKWSESNDSCLLVPDGENGININESSNGRGEDDELVLRFSATITFDPAVYVFNNTHMLAIAPSGRRNVTDSYVQIQAMFSERAADCDPNDITCSSAQTDSNGNNASNNSANSTNSNTNERSQNG